MDVLVVLGSKSDIEHGKKCMKILEDFKVNSKLLVASAHRSPEFLEEELSEAKKNNCKYIVAMAGMAAHLPGVIASKTLIPVIGVPLSGKNLSGLDACFSILQMPSGYPVATMSIDGAKNAALYVVQLLSIYDQDLSTKLYDYRHNLKDEIIKYNKNL